MPENPRRPLTREKSAVAGGLSAISDDNASEIGAQIDEIASLPPQKPVIRSRMVKQDYSHEEWKVLVGDGYYRQFRHKTVVAIDLFEVEEVKEMWIPPRVMRHWAFWDRSGKDWLLRITDDGAIMIGDRQVEARHLKKYWNLFYNFTEPEDWLRLETSKWYGLTFAEKHEAFERKKAREQERRKRWLEETSQSTDAD